MAWVEGKRDATAFGLLCFLIIVFLSAPPARADEFYALKLSGACDVRIGAITHVQSGEVSLLNLEGRIEKLPAAEVRTVFVFNSVGSPFRHFELSPALMESMKAVYLDDESKPNFYGWPVRFIDNLVVFSDIEGKSHVHDPEKILSMRTPTTAEVAALGITPKGNSFRFDLQDFFPECKKDWGSAEAGTALRPTRTIADEIRVRQLFEDLERNYDSLDNLQERTLFYARPFLYDREARLGFIFLQSKQELNQKIPAYLYWSNGRPFRFQSRTVAGANIDDHLPALEPVVEVRSDVKAHLFHATFAGNLFAFSGGSKFFTNISSFGVAGATMGPPQAEVQSSYNYMALLGVDYRRLSVSAGRYYPVYGIRSGTTTRELLSQDSAPMFDLGYTDLKLHAQFVIAPNRTRSVQAPTQDIILATDTVTFASPVISQLQSTAGFWRIGGDYRVMDRLRAGIAFFASRLSYSETVPSGTNSMDFHRWATSVTARQEFGDYVSLGVFWNYSHASYNVNFNTAPWSGVFSYSQLGGTLEFLF